MARGWGRVDKTLLAFFDRREDDNTIFKEKKRNAPFFRKKGSWLFYDNQDDFFCQGGSLQ
jgi:hypothetical protein